MFKNIKIQSQMMLVTLVSALVLVAMVMYVLHETGHVEALEVEYERKRELVQISDRAEKSLVKMSIQQSQFLESGEIFFAKKYTEYNQVFLNDIDLLASKDNSKSFEILSTKSEKMTALFNEVVNVRSDLGLNEAHGKLRKLKVNAELFEFFLKELAQSNQNIPLAILKDLHRHALMMRLDENNLTHQKETSTLVSLVEASLFDMRSFLQEAPMSDVQRAQVAAFLQSYEVALNEYVAAKTLLKQTYLDYIKINNEVKRELQHLIHSYNKKILPLMKASTQARSHMKDNLIIGMALGLVVVISVGVFATSNIVNHHQFTLSCLKKLAEGKYDFKIQSTEYAQELGEISQNLKVVQDKLLETNEPKPLEGPMREKALENNNIIDFRQKMFEMNRLETSGAKHRPNNKP